VALRPRLTTGLPFSLAHIQGCAWLQAHFQSVCYECTIHRFAAPRNTPWKLFVHMDDALCWIWGRSVRSQSPLTVVDRSYANFRECPFHALR
jgi:hypothetical protein